jgi:hypothetical protein
MRVRGLFFYMLVASLATMCRAQDAGGREMKKDEWQQQMTTYTSQRNDLNARMQAINRQVDSLQGLSTRLDDDYKKCLDALYALVGSNANEADAFRKDIDDAESNASELSRLSDADLMSRSADVDSLGSRVKRLMDNRLAVIPEFHDRLAGLDEKVRGMQNTLGGQAKIYTVGTWARNRDCLWNISKKRDIYNNAWMWPRIWQGNRDQVKDPDVIHQGQKLKIPKAGPLTADEKRAASRYYGKKS